MSEEAALLAAIRTHPDEDTPRLVYADWLQEHDQADRAEFIRLQCEVVRMPLGKEARTKAKRADAQFKANKDAWFGPLLKVFSFGKPFPGVRECCIDRGFITSLTGSTQEFLSHADAIDNFAPCLRTAAVTSVREGASTILAKPFVRRVAELGLETLWPTSVAAFNETPAWGPLDGLRVTFEFSDESDTLKGFSEAPIVRAAARVGVQYGYFLPEDDNRSNGGYPAAQEPSLREMRRLKIPQLREFGIHGLGALSVAEVARWPQFKRLDCLDFGICNITNPAAVALLSAPTLPKLTTLLLNENDIGGPTAEALAACPQLAELKYLVLRWCNFDDAGARRLAASKTLPTELVMDVSHNDFTERGLAKLRERFGAGVVSRDQRG